MTTTTSDWPATNTQHGLLVACGEFLQQHEMNSSYKPHGYTTVSPYLIVDDASRTIEFLVRVFDATELRRFPDASGKLMHAEVRIDDTVLMLADDVAAALQQLGIEQADIGGYSTGAAVALHVAIRHPHLVRKLVLVSVSYNLGGIHPGLMEGLGEMKAEMMHGSPWHTEYMQIAPHPENFATLFAKKTQMDKGIRDISAETIQGLKTPTLLIIGDTDLVRPEHAVEMFRLLGGGVFGDMPPGLPASQLAILPGTSHVSVVYRADLLLPILTAFLDAPMPEAK